MLPEVKLIPGGHSIGIKLHSQGVNVVGYYYFNESGKSVSPAREAGVKLGDTILKINGKSVNDAPGAARLLEDRGGKRVELLISRHGETFKLSLTPRYSASDGAYRIGLYLRDSAAGVGTLTFYDPLTKRYGALGHVILDSDTHQPINLSEGSIVKAKIISIKAAQRGQPGEKTGIFVDDASAISIKIHLRDFERSGIFSKCSPYRILCPWLYPPRSKQASGDPDRD